MLLTPDHYALLHDQSAIADTLITARGYQSLPQPEDLIDRGFSKAQARTAPALGIPLWDVHGQRHGWQIRPDSPRQMKDGKVFRYEMPKGDHLILDVHPSVQPRIGDPHEPLWITEGIKKGDALASRGVCTIALNGVRGYRGTNDYGGKVILQDWEYVALNGREVYVVYDSDIYTKPDVEAALKALYRLLRDRAARPALVCWPEEYRQHKWGVDDFFAKGHTLDELRAMVPPQGPLPTVPLAQRNGHGLTPQSRADTLLTDTFNATAFVADHGHKLRYCYPWKTWLVWTGTYWQRDTSGEVMRLAKETVKKLGRRVEVLDDEKQIADLLAHIKASLSTAKLKALIENAQSEPGIAVQPAELDADLWLLNCANGTLDLRTGTLRPHQQTNMLTKCLDVAYDPDATSPTWHAFLWRVMGGSLGEDDPDTMSAGELENRRAADDRAHEMIAYLQRTAGYTLTGSTREQCLFLCHGPTKTGKSTYLATLRALLGPYGKQADMQTFMHKDRPEVRNDLADLAGARYVYAVESQEGKRLAESLVKQITGGVDAMKARFLYEELFEFKPQFKAYLGTNHLPTIKDSDDAIWERIRRIPFIIQIPKDERDKDLEHRLLDELPGILTWAVQGCLDWQAKKDLKEPDQVLDANRAYRAEMDVVARFLDECCRLQAQFQIKAGDLHTAFLTWCEGTGVRTMTRQEFGKRLEEKEFEKRTSNFVWWLGVTLKDN